MHPDDLPSGNCHSYNATPSIPRLYSDSSLFTFTVESPLPVTSCRL